jgi:hypothetical protein
MGVEFQPHLIPCVGGWLCLSCKKSRLLQGGRKATWEHAAGLDPARGEEDGRGWGQLMRGLT